MLYPDYFQTLPTEVFDLYQTIEDDIISDIARRIKKAGTITDTAEWQIQALLRQGNGYREIKKEIRKKTEIANKELTKLINQTAIKAYAEDMKKYKIGGIHLPAYKSNSAVLQIVEAMKKNGLRDMKNISNTLGVPFQGRDIPLNEFYQRTLGRAVLQVTSGAFSLDEVLKRTIRELGDRGIRSVDWESGYSTTIETAARRSVFTTLTQLSSKISNQNLRDTGAEYVEVSAHSGARPDHADWQGQVYHVGGEKNGYKDFASSTDYGSERGLCGYNCRHSFFPFFPGVSDRSYTDEDLKDIDPPPRSFEGKKYSHYEATQKQRQIENSIRKSKRKLAGYEAAGDTDAFTVESVRLQRKRERYSEFSKAMDLPKRNNRTLTFGYNKNIDRKVATSAANARRSVAQPARSAAGSTVNPQKGVFGTPYDHVYARALQHGLSTGTECLMWVDLAGKDIIPFASGTNNQVVISQSDIAILSAQPKNSVISVHNHPKSSSFSAEDISLACRLPSVKEMQVIGHDGTLYILEIGNGARPQYNEIVDEFNRILQGTFPKFQSIENKINNPGRTWKMHSNHIVKQLAKQYGWIYKRRLP